MRSLEGKIEARERDRNRKRRDQLSSDKLESIRLQDRNYKKLRRQNMTDTEKQKARETRNNKNNPKKKRNLKNLKEMKKIEEVIRIRKFRTLLSEKEKNIVKMNSRVGMALCRKNGSLRAYKQRKKRDLIDLNVWRKFFKNDVFVDLFMETNSKKEKVREKLKSVKRQIRDFENKKMQEEQWDRLWKGRVWKGRSLNKEEETYSKDNVRTRKYRTKIKQKIIINESCDSKSSDEETDDDDEDNSDNIH